MIVQGFEQHLANRLSAAARELPPEVSGRLVAARERALAAHQAAAGASLSRWWRWSLAPSLGPALLCVAVMAVAVAGNMLGSQNVVHEHAAIDAALLSDDLPIDAYLDPGFKAWLQHAVDS